MLLQQIFQHSGWILPQVVLYTTLEQVQSDDLIVITTFLNQREQCAISNREIEILQVASCMDIFVDQLWLGQATGIRFEQMQSLCTQIGSQNGYVFSFALANVRLRHRKFVADVAVPPESVFMWQSVIAKRLFQEAFTTKYSQLLLDTGKYLLSRYRAQFSKLERITNRFVYYLPSLQESQAQALAENIADDIQAEFGLTEEPKIEQKSSLMRLIQRKSHTKIVSSMTRFQTCTYSNSSEFEQKFDGMFVSIEQLMLCLNPCAQYCTDLFD